MKKVLIFPIPAFISRRYSSREKNALRSRDADAKDYTPG
jgi:hypothetical protein